MRKIIFFAMFIVAISFTSCTDVEVPESPVQQSLSKQGVTKASEASVLSFESKVFSFLK